MNKYYENLMNLDEAKGLKELIGKWENLSANMEKYPANAPIILPDLFVTAKSASMVSRLVENLSGYLAFRSNIMDFYGDVRYFEFMLNYCCPEEDFNEIRRLMDEVITSAGFRSIYKGIVHIRIDAWLGHQEEQHFINFLDYLAENTGDWLIILSVSSGEDEKVMAMESVVSMFLRIQRIELNMPSTETYVAELEAMIGKYHFRLSEGAAALLAASVDVLKENRYFDSLYTMRLLCSDIVYEMYSGKPRSSMVLTEDDLKDFSSGSPYIRRTIKKMTDSRKIGFIKDLR